MLVASTISAPTRTGLGAAMEELVALKEEANRCIARLPFVGSDDQTFSAALTCESRIAEGKRGAGGLVTLFDKLTLLEPEDQALMFEIARDILLDYRNAGVGPTVSDRELEFRLIAVKKLIENADAKRGTASPTLAVQHLSSVARTETDPTILSRIIAGLRDLLSTRDVGEGVRVEAINTLEILTSPLQQPNDAVRAAARAALQVVAPSTKIEIGPVAITPIESKRPKFLIPIIATVTTAVVATGVLWYIFRRRPPAASLSDAGPLRRRVEGPLRRRRVRRSRS